MSVTLESLEFEIQSNSASAAQGIDALTASLNRLRGVSRNLSAVSSANHKLQQLNATLGNLRIGAIEKLANAFSQLNNVQLSSSLHKRLAQISGAMTILTDDNVARLGKTADAIERFRGFSDITLAPTLGNRIRDLADAIGNLTDEGLERLNRLADGLRNIGTVRDVQVPRMRMDNPAAPNINPTASNPVHSAVSQASQQAEEMRESIGETVRAANQMSQALQNIATAAQAAQAAIHWIAAALQILINVLRAAVKMIDRLLTPIRKLGKVAVSGMLSPFNRIIKSIKDIGKKTKQYIDAIGRVAVYRAIRAAIKNMSQAIQEGIHNLYQYSRIVGTDFAKSMDKIATSALYVKNSLAAMVSPLINQIAPIIDSIGDKIAEIANKVNIFISRLLGKSTYTAAKKLQTTFEEIKSAVIGIDELNIIGDGEKDYAEMFEELPITGEDSFVNKLRELFENADWIELGRFIGSKINELIEKIDWKEIGRNVGGLFDAVFKVFYGFLSEVDTEKLGNSVADLINEFLNAIDWKVVGRLLVRQITILWDFMIGFFEQLDWGEVARTLMDFLSGALDEIHDWLKSYNWLDLGERFLNNLKEFFNNFDFTSLLKHFFTVFGESVRAMKDLLTPLWEAFKTWWNDHIKGKDFIETIKNLVDYLLKFFDENIITPFIKGFLGDDKMEGSGLQQLKELGENILAGILKGISDWIGEKLQDWILNRLFGPFINAVRWVFGIHSPAETMIPIGENIILGILEGMVLKVGEVLESIGNLCISIINAFSEGLSNLISTVADVAVSVVTVFGQGLSEMITAGSEAVIQVITVISAGLSEMVTATAEASRQVVTALGSGLAGMVSTATESASQVVSALGAGLSGMISAAASAASQVVSALGSGLAGMIGVAASAASQVVSALGSGLAGMISAAAGAASQVVSALGSGLAGMIGATTSAASQVVTALGSGLAGMISATSNAASQVVSALGSGLAGMVGAAASAVSGVLQAMSSGFSSVISAVANAASSIVSAFAISKLSQSVNELSDNLSQIPQSVSVEIKYEDPGWEPPQDATVTVNIVYNDPGWGGGHAAGGILTAPTFFHAVGGIVDRPTFFHAAGATHVMGEAGREAILPLQNHTEWMNEIAERTREAMAKDEQDGTAFYLALGRFFNEYLNPVMSEISADTKRQADKKEGTVVKIGNKDIKTAYDTQKKADGYSFTR